MPKRERKPVEAQSIIGTWVWARGAMEVALDINNATNQSNPCCTDLSRVDGVLRTRTRSWLPRYFNLGVVWSLP